MSVHVATSIYIAGTGNTLAVTYICMVTGAAYRFYQSKSEGMSIKRRGMGDERAKMKRRYERRVRVSIVMYCSIISICMQL